VSAPRCGDVFPSVMLGPLRCELEEGHDGAHQTEHPEAFGSVRWVPVTEDQFRVLAELVGDAPGLFLEHTPRGAPRDV